PRRQALVETVDFLPGECLKQPELGLRRDDGDRLEEPPGGRTEARGAGEDRVPDRVRYLLGARGERLDDEERVAGGLAVEVVGVDGVRFGELRDRRGRESTSLSRATVRPVASSPSTIRSGWARSSPSS